MNNWTKMPMAVLAGCVVLAGCSQGDGTSGPDGGSDKSESVTLVMYQVGSGIEDNEFQEIIAGPVKKKYPHITVKLYRFAQGETLESLVGAQQFPDLVFAGILDVSRLKQLGLIADLNPFIRKFKYDVSQLKTAATDMVAKYGDKGEMYAMPLSLGFPIMYYNSPA
jgi:multiple sugar transport system substrate-binding protein